MTDGKPGVGTKLRRAARFEVKLKGGAPPKAAEAQPMDALEAVRLRISHLKADQRAQDLKLRWVLAIGALLAVGAQLVVANMFFAHYLFANLPDIEPSVMIAWLSACVIEVVGILWVIARNLFPYRDKSVPKGKKDSSSNASNS